MNNDRSGSAPVHIIGGAVLVLTLAALVGVLLFGPEGFMKILQGLADWLTGLETGFEPSALNSAKAMSYAYSCSALIHAYPECGGFNDGEWESTACSEIAQSWNNDAVPRSDEINVACSKATGGGRAEFGRVSVICDGLDSGGDASAGCTVHGFTLPQTFGDNVVEQAANFIRGHGLPKYLLYYERYDTKYTQEWETHLASTSALALVGSAVAQGMFAAIVVGGTVGTVSGGSVQRQSAREILASIDRQTMRSAVDAVFSGLRGLPDSIGQSFTDAVTRVRGTGSLTYDELLDKLRFRIDYRLRAVRSGFPSIQDIVFVRREQVEELNYEVLLRNALSDVAEATNVQQLKRQRVLTRVMWEGSDSTPGLQQAMREGMLEPAANGRTIREMVEDGEDEAATDIVQRRMKKIFVDQAGQLPDSIEPVIDDTAEGFVASVRTGVDGEQLARQQNVDEAIYWRIAAASSSESQDLLELARAGKTSTVRRRLNELEDEGSAIMTSLGSEEASEVIAKTETSICGARPTVQVAATLAAQDIAESVLSDAKDAGERNRELLRTGLATVPAAQYEGQKAWQAVRSACGNGGSPINALKGASGIGTAWLVSSMMMGKARKVRQNLPQVPQGVNSLVLIRSDYGSEPVEYPLNKYANWWYLNLDPGQEVQIEGASLTDPGGRRFMTASPCYPRSTDGESKSRIDIQEETNTAILKPTASGAVQSAPACYWGYASTDATEPDRFCEGPSDIQCSNVNSEQLCQSFGRCTWSESLVSSDYCTRKSSPGASTASCSSLTSEQVCNSASSFGCSWRVQQSNAQKACRQAGNREIKSCLGLPEDACTELRDCEFVDGACSQKQQPREGTSMAAGATAGPVGQCSDLQSKETCQAVAGGRREAPGMLGSYATDGGSITEGVIGYTRGPVVHPGVEVASEVHTQPPGQDEFSNAVVMEFANDTRFSQGRWLPSHSAVDEPVPYYDQRGWWYWDADDRVHKQYIPERKITADGRGVRTFTRPDIWTWTVDVATVFDGQQERKKKDIHMLSARFKNTNLGQTGNGPNYCYSRIDTEAAVAKWTIAGGAIGLELVLEGADVLSFGTSYAATGAVEFLIGTSEYLLIYGAQTVLGDAWPY